ncbi:MAG: trypsin-like peptidase domain-containing protein [Actinomycetota bacterium]
MSLLLGLGLHCQVQALTATEFYEKVSPSVWKVITYDQDGLALSQGSAVVVGPERLITNCHVLRKAKRFVVRQDNTAHGATLEYLDVQRDLCQIKVKNLVAPAVAVVGTRGAKVGQSVFTLGNPKGLELTLGAGLLSALRKDENDNIVWVQTSAPVSSGSSGGGLFDEQGRLIGITSLIIAGVDAQNLSFALPAEWIADLPARHASAVKAQQESAAAEKKIAQKPEAGPSTEGDGRQVTGSELGNRFRGLGRVQATTRAGQLLQLTIDAGGTLQVANILKGGYTKGNYEIREDDGQVCFTMRDPGWSVMGVCYRMYLTGEGRFAMRSVSDKYFFTFSK